MIADEEADKKKGDEGDAVDSSTVVNRRQLDDYRASEEFQTYEALCRGEDIVVSHMTTTEALMGCFVVSHMTSTEAQIGVYCI